MYFISAPFGNYLHLQGVVSVTGTWTVDPRPGRIKQIVKTLRYTKTGWRNKLGLRNPGLRVGMLKTNYDDCLSLAAINPQDWNIISDMISIIRNVELNISCPNLDSHEDTTQFEGFSRFTKQQGEWRIVKVPPTSSTQLIDRIVDFGYTQIHASNTLHTDKGGLSGRILIPHTIRLIKYIKYNHPHVEVIAGGGVYTKEDAQRYIDAGADHVSLGTVCFTPWRIKNILHQT